MRASDILGRIVSKCIALLEVLADRFQSTVATKQEGRADNIGAKLVPCSNRHSDGLTLSLGRVIFINSTEHFFCEQ